MGYVEDTLERGEIVVYQARISAISYIIAIVYLISVMTPGKISGLASTKFVITDRRVIGKTGMLMRKNIAVKFKDVALVKAQQGVMGKIFNYGAVIVIDKEGNRVKFKGISEPLDVQLQVEEAVEMAVLGRKLSQFAMEKF